MADDVYVVKPSDLAVGESTADETTYAAFKRRKTGVSNDRQVFSDANNFGFDNNRFLPFGNNHPRFLGSSQFPNGSNRNFFLMDDFSWMGHQSWDTQVLMSHWYGYNNGVWNGNSYGYNYHSWGNNGFGNGFGFAQGNGFCHGNGFGFPQGGFGFGGNGFIANDNQNIFRGPRGSVSGFANPKGRQYTSVLKSGTTNQPNTSQSANIGRASASQTSSPVIERRPINTINAINTRQPAVRYNSSVDINRNSGKTSNRTYTRSDVGSRPSGTTYQSRSNSGSSGRSGGGTINSSSGSGRSGGGTINSSSGSGRSSGGTVNSSSGSGRSSGTSTGGGGGSSRSGGNSGGTSGGRR